MIQPINPVTLVLFVVWEDFFHLWLCPVEATWTLDRNSMLPHRPEVQEKYILNFETCFFASFCSIFLHRFRKKSLQVASLRRGIGVCAMLGESQLRVRVPSMCQRSRDAGNTSLLIGDRWLFMYFSYIMYVL